VNSRKSRGRTTTHFICLHHAFSCQRSLGHGERNHKKRQDCEAVVSSILRIGGPDKVQEILFQNGEDLLCNHHECQEASTLL
jgi:hypothetical protein